MRPELEVKINNSLKQIKEVLEASSKPVCLSSFGKDSIVMLDLILKVKKIPVIYFKDSFFQSKLKHPQEIAEKWDLEIFDYPPSFTDYIQLEDYFEIYNFHYTNGKDWINLSTGIRKYKDSDSKFLCAVNDILDRPKVPAYYFKWGCIFLGHKQSDDIHIGKCEVPRMNVFGNGLLVMPIRDWTDEDIWEYIKEFNVPYNKERYDDKNEYRNNDIYPTCYDCLDYRNIGKEVMCPKLNKLIPCTAKSKEANEKFRDVLLSKFYKER